MKIGTTSKMLPTVMAAAFCCGFAAADCNESLLYDNGFPNGCNGAAAQIGGPFTSGFPQAADDFGDLGGATVEDAHWYTLDAAAGIAWTGDVEIQFYEEDSVLPCLPLEVPYCDLIVGPGGVGIVTSTVVQSPGPFGFDRVRYDASCFECTTVAGNNNFVSLRPISAAGGAQSFWETTRCASGGDAIVGCEMAFRGATFGFVTWTPGTVVFADQYDLNFQLTQCVAGGDCPCDLNGDGFINVQDLLQLIVDCWQQPCGDCTGDGIGNVSDLLAILGPDFGGPCEGGDGSNDLCDNAYLIFEGTYGFDTSGANTDGLPDPLCLAFGQDQIFNDIWYCYKAGCTNQVTVSLCGSEYDTRLAVYAADGTCSIGDIIACNDDACSLQSELQFLATEGEHYKIRVGGFSDGGGGVGTMEIFCGSGFANQDCESAAPINVGDVVSGDTAGVAPSGQIPCDASPADGALWYSVIGTGNNMTADTCSVNTGDVNIYVMCGESCNDLLCVGAYIQDNDVLCFDASGTARADWCSIAGQKYWIAVQGNGAAATFDLAVTDGAACGDQEQCVIPGPENDDCDARIPAVDGDNALNTINASTDGVAHATCEFDGQTYHDVWFNYTASCDGLATIQTCNIVDYDSDIAVYTGCDTANCPPGDADLLGCNDDGGGCAGFSSLVTVPVSAGQCYKIRVGGWMDGDQGTGTLNISCGAPCVLECPAGASLEQGPQECPVDGDDANNDGNGGCNNAVPSYGTIACGETVCGDGSTYIDIGGGAFRDTDWYEIVHPGGDLTATCSSTQTGPMLFGVVDHQGGACSAPAFIAFGTSTTDCLPSSVTAAGLAPGTYVIFAAPNAFAGYVCGVNSAYVLTASCP